jgi:DNA-binding NarL/FixJ family response regulator
LLRNPATLLRNPTTCFTNSRIHEFTYSQAHEFTLRLPNVSTNTFQIYPVCISYSDDAMDLTSRIKEFRSRQRSVRSWFLTTMLPQGCVMASGNRLTLLLLGQLILRQNRPFKAITTEAEAVDAVAALEPGWLVVASPLEEGNAFSLCRKARQQQPKLKILLILDAQESKSAFREIDALVDAVLHTHDIGGDDYPLVTALMAILRSGRYRSPSLRQPQQGVTGSPAVEQRSSEPQLTPREQEVLDLIGRGLSDRQIATSLGLSYETARTYVKTVRRKLGSNNRLAAAAWSWRRRPDS